MLDRQFHLLNFLLPHLPYLLNQYLQTNLKIRHLTPYQPVAHYLLQCLLNHLDLQFTNPIHHQPWSFNLLKSYHLWKDFRSQYHLPNFPQQCLTQFLFQIQLILIQPLVPHLLLNLPSFHLLLLNQELRVCPKRIWYK